MPNGNGKQDRFVDSQRALIDEAQQQFEAAGKRRLPDSLVQGSSAFAGPPADSFTGYTILREVHRGGQGVVYKAVQESTKRTVAIKVMREGPFAGSPDKSRFDREVRILGQLNHPNIVAIHDTGVAAGFHYFVMDFISGQPLDVYMTGDTRQRAVKTTLKLFVKICDAVNEAHLRGVIHRDLKPGNIRIDTRGEPHVLDFGLAKVAMDGGQDARPTQARTMTGQFVGSLPWASPEQAEGLPGKIDVRTDVYSLGVVLYQMLTGHFPYEVTGPMADVLNRIMTAEPARPRAVRKDINDEVETIVLKCLAKEPERRYQTAGELGRDVQRYLKGDPIEAKRDSVGYVLRKRLRRHKLPAGFAAAFLLLLASSAVASTTLWLRADEDRRLAEAARTEADNRAQELEQVVAFQASQLAGLNAAFSLWGYRGSTTDYVLDALPRLREVMEERERVLGPEHPYTLDSKMHLGRIFRKLKKHDEAEPYLQQALSGYRRVLGDDDARTIECMAWTGATLRKLGRLDEAERLGAEAANGARAMVLPGRSEAVRIRMTADIITTYASSLRALERFAQAEEVYVEVHAICEAALGAAHGRTRLAARRLASFYDTWHAAEPDAGHDAKAAEWRPRRKAFELPESAADDDR